MKTTILKQIGIIMLLVITVSFSANAQEKDQKLEPFYYDCSGLKDKHPSQIICKPDESGKHLQLHLKYDFTYDQANRLSQKDAYKWNAVKGEWTPYYKQTFTYNVNEIETHYAKWDKRKKAYTPVHEKAIYTLADSGVIAYTNYKRAAADEWKLITDFSNQHPNRLIAEK